MFSEFKENQKTRREQIYENLQDPFVYEYVDRFSWLLMGVAATGYIMTTGTIAKQLPGYTKFIRAGLVVGVIGLLGIRRELRRARGCTC